MIFKLWMLALIVMVSGAVMDVYSTRTNFEVARNLGYVKVDEGVYRKTVILPDGTTTYAFLKEENRPLAPFLGTSKILVLELFWLSLLWFLPMVATFISGKTWVNSTVTFSLVFGAMRFLATINNFMVLKQLLSVG